MKTYIPGSPGTDGGVLKEKGLFMSFWSKDFTGPVSWYNLKPPKIIELKQSPK